MKTKQEIKSATDIVQLIQDSVPLRQHGREYRGLCPWHEGNEPTLVVNLERQSWKCWVCDIGGDCLSWVMAIEGVDCGEAIKRLAERAELKGREDTVRMLGPQVDFLVEEVQRLSDRVSALEARQ